MILVRDLGKSDIFFLLQQIFLTFYKNKKLKDYNKSCQYTWKKVCEIYSISN